MASFAGAFRSSLGNNWRGYPLITSVRGGSAMRKTGRRCGALAHSPRITDKPEAMMNCLRSRVMGKFALAGQNRIMAH
jgi:hypothetical protein